MICISCATEIPEGTKYCPVCATQQPAPKPQDLSSDSAPKAPEPAPQTAKKVPFTEPMGGEELENGVLSEDSKFFPDVFW